MGAVMKLCLERRGINKNYQYLTNDRLEMIFELPLAEVIYDFYDKLKSITQGYGSFDYDLIEYRRTDLVKLDFLINGRTGGCTVHADPPGQCGGQGPRGLRQAQGRDSAPDVQDRQHPGGPSAAISSPAPRYRHFARDVTAKCYGGDITRKRKLLEKTEKRKEAHENGGPGDAAPVRLSGRFENRQRINAAAAAFMRNDFIVFCKNGKQTLHRSGSFVKSPRSRFASPENTAIAGAEGSVS